MKKLIILTLILLFISIIVIFTRLYPIKRFTNFIGTNEHNITKVSMKPGYSMKLVSTTDKVKIKELFDLLDNRFYMKSINQPFIVGYSYFYDFYVGKKLVLRITGDGNRVQMNNTYYYVSKKISFDLLSDWYNSLPSS
jgi:hypothetical protein